MDDMSLSKITKPEKETEEKKMSSEQLNQAFQKQVLPSIVRVSQNLEEKVSQEKEIFENGGQRGPNLQLAFDILCTIPPTSVEAERCFSAAGLILTK